MSKAQPNQLANTATRDCSGKKEHSWQATKLGRKEHTWCKHCGATQKRKTVNG